MLSRELAEVFLGEMTPKFLATRDAGGKPNCVPVTSMVPWDDTTLVFGEFLMNKSRKNLLEDRRVGVAVINDKFEGWSLKGTFLGFETTGALIDKINSAPMFRYNAYTSVRSAGSIRIDEVSAKITVSTPRLIADYLRLRMIAPLAKRGGPVRMPARVAEKFTRMQAVRAMAFLDEDGHPRALPIMACLPAGANRVVMRGPMLNAYREHLRTGMDLAIAIITTEPIAYQVKGRLLHFRGGAGVVELDACYSASPPLLGARLDAPDEAGETTR